MSLCELTCETAAGDEEDAEEELSRTRRSHVFSLAAWIDALEMPVLFCALSLGPGGFCTHSLSSPLPLSSSFYSSNSWNSKVKLVLHPAGNPHCISWFITSYLWKGASASFWEATGRVQQPPGHITFPPQEHVSNLWTHPVANELTLRSTKQPHIDINGIIADEMMTFLTPSPQSSLLYASIPSIFTLIFTVMQMTPCCVSPAGPVSPFGLNSRFSLKSWCGCTPSALYTCVTFQYTPTSHLSVWKSHPQKMYHFKGITLIYTEVESVSYWIHWNTNLRDSHFLFPPHIKKSGSCYQANPYSFTFLVNIYLFAVLSASAMMAPIYREGFRFR